jgi:hypothetical protein
MSNIIFSKKFLQKINSIIRNFWWTGVNSDLLDSLEKHLRAKRRRRHWHSKFTVVNHVLILGSAWRIAERRNSQLHEILKSKYSPYTTKPNKPKSAFWTSILKVFRSLQENLFYQISKGNISIWSSLGVLHGRTFMIIPLFRTKYTPTRLW